MVDDALAHLGRSADVLTIDPLTLDEVLPAGVPVHAVDANASWAGPGTRLVDGVEELARQLQP